MDADTIQMITGLISIIATIAFPTATAKIKAAQLLSNEIVEFVKRDEKENKEFFKQAKESGLKNLADHINKKVDSHIDFYTG